MPAKNVWNVALSVTCTAFHTLVVAEHGELKGGCVTELRHKPVTTGVAYVTPPA